MVGEHEVLIVHEDDVEHLWPLVQPWLERLHKRHKGVAPDKLREMVDTGEAFLVIYGKQGFAIFTPLGDTYFVISMAAFSGVCDFPIEQIISNATEHAKGLGFKRVEVGSPRKAWWVILPKLGFVWDGEFKFTLEL
ncbi:hypothetical protein [Shewanella gaetbuli]|uniref:Uncharacterized protein n=1 Tax=Shewanella gaetbuli TaxID=220752 RepID=A0A9X2CKD1_9GAMM|nr:hypothetical protein [Shewanella gaetbuli]MCL1142981.1 hypothetical protein [Shewanella gaetbuli]